jgi:radical SAM-linked protein
MTPEFYCYRERGKDEVFPWDHLQGGPENRVLWNDFQTAMRQAAEAPPDHPHLKERPFVQAPKAVRLAPQRTVQRMRFKMSRTGSMRFLSHLEQIEMIRRALRRADFPVVFTSGFHPQMKVSFGPAISVGYESECEFFDVDLAAKIDLEEGKRMLSEQMPGGFSILRVSRIPLFFPSLESLVNRVDYEVFVPSIFLKGEEHARSLEEFFQREDLVIEKIKKKGAGAERRIQIALKPLVIEASWNGGQNRSKTFGNGRDGRTILFSFRFGPGKNVKPEKVAALFLSLSEEESLELAVNRKAFWVEKSDGSSVEP